MKKTLLNGLIIKNYVLKELSFMFLVKKFLIMFLLCLVTLSFSDPVAANQINKYNEIAEMNNDKEQIKKVVELYFTEYNDSLTTQIMPDIDYLFEKNINTDLHKKMLSYDIEYKKMFNTKYKDFQNLFDFKKIDVNRGSASLSLIYGIDINYEHLEGIITKGRNFNYDIKLIKDGQNWKIKSIDSDIEAAKMFKKELNINSLEEIKENDNLQIENIFDLLNKNARNLKNSINVSTRDSNKLLEDNTHTTTISPLATVNYNRDNGTAYARKYGNSKAPYFYKTSSDCTNFVSQCIWAGYGGWDPNGDSNGVNSSRVSNRYRMTSTWYAGSGGGSPNWENVNSFYNFITSNSGNGPKGTSYQVDKTPSNFSYGYISYGDVIQGKTASSSTYVHSIYISNVLKPGSPVDILYCSHSGDWVDQQLTYFTQWVGTNGIMRGISPKTTTY